MKQFLQKYGAYLVAAVIFLSISVVYFLPSIKGNIINAADDVSATNNMGELRSHDWSKGSYGYWNGSVFSGMPNYQLGGASYSSDRLISPIKQFCQKGAWGAENNKIWMLIFYFFSFFIVMRAFGVEKWTSILGSIAISLSSYFIVIIATGHYGKTISLTFIPLVAAGFHLIFKKKYGIGAALVMLFMAGAYTAHPQMTYYIFLMIGLFAIAEIWIHVKEKRYKDLAVGIAVFVFSLAIGIGTGSASALANFEFASESVRGGQSDLSSTYDTRKFWKATHDDSSAAMENMTGTGSNGLNVEIATSWSYGIDETLSLLIPGIKGGATVVPLDKDSYLYHYMIDHDQPAKGVKDFCNRAPMYWGEQSFTAGNVYVGAIICFLFLLGCLIVKGPYKWALVASTLFSILLSWGNNFMPLTELFFKYFPLYNKFRAVSSILVIAEIAMPLLACLALSDILSGKVLKKDLSKKILISFGITAGICLFLALFGGMIFDFKGYYDPQYQEMYPDWLYAGILEQRAIILRHDCWRSILFIAAAVAVLLLFNSSKIKKGWTVAALTLLVFADLWSVDHRYFNDSNFKTSKIVYADNGIKPYEEEILKDPELHFRVLNVTTNDPFSTDSRTSRYLKSIGGSTAVKLRRYQDLINVYLTFYDRRIAGMLNTKYIIYPTADGDVSYVWNDQVLGNAWYVDQIVVADNADEEMDALNEIDLANVAVIDKSFRGAVKDLNPAKPEGSFVRLKEYQPKYIDYQSCSPSDGVVVFSEVYYPHGWKATIDGQPADYFRANYTLRAMNVPAGVHDIHFEFDPDSVNAGTTIAVICIYIMYAFLALIVVWYLYRGLRIVLNKKK